MFGKFLSLCLSLSSINFLSLKLESIFEKHLEKKTKRFYINIWVKEELTETFIIICNCIFFEFHKSWSTFWCTTRNNGCIANHTLNFNRIRCLCSSYPVFVSTHSIQHFILPQRKKRAEEGNSLGLCLCFQQTNSMFRKKMVLKPNYYYFISA